MPTMNRTVRPDHKAISIPFDANFFFKRGLISFQRYDLDKAFKYFKKCVDLDAEHPDYRMHFSAVLTELGEYEHSNDILVRLVEYMQHQELPDAYFPLEMHTSLDQLAADCHYFMANNFVFLGELEKAERQALLYLASEPEGAYCEEAEDMIDYICFELDRPPIDLEDEEDFVQAHEQARVCLEQGNFLEASHLLKQIVHDYPSFIAAQNNLALAYYFMGEFEKAVQTIDEIFEQDPVNLHALCNLVLFYNRKSAEARQPMKINERLDGLKKVQPIHVDHYYKLATTLGVLGEDQRAFELFHTLSRRGLHDDATLFHYLAVSNFNLKRHEQALSYWSKARKLDPDSEVVHYYMQMMSDPNGDIPERISYHYELPYDVKWKRENWNKGKIPQELLDDPLVRSSLFWSLQHGDRDTKLQVIQSLQFFNDNEAEQALRQIIRREEEEDYVKKVAVFVLRQMGAKTPYQAYFNEKLVEIDAHWIDESCPVWKSRWNQVIKCMQTYMEGEYDLLEHQQAQMIWTKYLRRCYPDLPQIRKPQAWAAPIEFLIAQNAHRKWTKTEVAKKYGVSVSSLSRNLYLIEKSMLEYYVSWPFDQDKSE